eukprot:1136394-Pelagomonas_calceolata.AAC.2
MTKGLEKQGARSIPITHIPKCDPKRPPHGADLATKGLLSTLRVQLCNCNKDIGWMALARVRKRKVFICADMGFARRAPFLGRSMILSTTLRRSAPNPGELKWSFWHIDMHEHKHCIGVLARAIDQGSLGTGDIRHSVKEKEKEKLGKRCISTSVN